MRQFIKFFKDIEQPLVVIDQDILTIDAERIPKTKVHYTIVGGEVRYQRASQ